MKIVGKEKERLSNKKDEVHKEHKKINKTRKGLVDKSYEDAIKAIENKDEKRSVRIKKESSKIRLVIGEFRKIWESPIE